MVDSFARRHARSQRFTLGRPRTLSVSPDGQRVWYLSSSAGDDAVHHLHLHTPADGATRRIVDAAELDDPGTLTDAERARRERAREGAGGIVGYATDRAGRRATFVLAGRTFVVDDHGARMEVVADGALFDPRLSGDGSRLAGVVDGAVHVADLPGTLDAGGSVEASRLVGAGPSEEAVTWGLAEFVAAEEFGRQRGHWSSADGSRLLVARVDAGGVAVAHVAAGTDPTRPPRADRYPFAGTANAVVDLHLLELETDDDGIRVAADQIVGPPDRVDAEYLVDVTWEPDRPALVTWQDRGQRQLVTVALDDATGATDVVAEVAGDPWVEPVAGAPCWAGDDVLVVADVAELGPEGTRTLVHGGRVVGPPGLQVRSVVEADADRVVVRASVGDPTSIAVVAVSLADGDVSELVASPGVHAARVGGDTRVEVTSDLAEPPVTTVVGPTGRTVLPDRAMDPGLDVEVDLFQVAGDDLWAGVVLPDGQGPFPVLLAPYGGPHAQLVLRSRNTWLHPAWFASHGYAVVVVDGRGTPGRSPAFEHEVHLDLAAGVLADQVTGLHAAADRTGVLDLDRVAIRGWSFGGYLAGLAALRRPDVFRAAILGAPPTDWRLYDTHYTERYLGHPDDHPDAYTASSLVGPDGQLVGAVDTADPPAMLLIHGLADDNVLAAHSLRLSRALLAAGRPHRFLPLSGVSHMTPQEVVAENLLHLQLDFLRTTLDA